MPQSVTCEICGEPIPLPYLECPCTENQPWRSSANKNAPPVIRAKTYKELMTVQKYIELGLKSHKLGLSRRDFIIWVAETLLAFQKRGGLYLKPMAEHISGDEQQVLHLTERDILLAFNIRQDENFSINEKKDDDCRWVGKWWGDCATGIPKNAPQKRLYVRLCLIDLALRTPQF